ncbi:hypothetical protein WA1_50720 [Scytonema hofmannii PCC 7110]|uniref:Uncharacterized protein n=1 Tax=Scytonema hofmannii PCC 7110 TaxID=128403 RepID=A0A139WPZ7_9CYAN|nr:hypothetical protein [Scytonema hofmannii]KYC34505.1 hypothetical protein WA1_50720 [Scytonema hofmannii PCC 7110]
MKTQRQDMLSKTIALFLVLQMFLIGLQGTKRINQGDATIEVLICVLNQYIVLLQKARSLKEQEDRSNLKKEKINGKNG